MMKSVQAKVILMFFIIGIIIILGIGFFSIRIAEQNLGNIENMAKVLNSEISQIKILILISILVFSCIMLIMSAFVIKVLVKPVNNLIKNAQKVAEMRLCGDQETLPDRRRHTTGRHDIASTDEHDLGRPGAHSKREISPETDGSR